MINRLLAIALLLALAPAAGADEIDSLNNAIESYNDAKYRPAAEAFLKHLAAQ